MYKTHVSPDTNLGQGRSASTGIKPTRAMQNICLESQYSSAFIAQEPRDPFPVSLIILLYINLNRILISCFNLRFFFLEPGADRGFGLKCMSASRVTVLMARIGLIFILPLNGA